MIEQRPGALSPPFVWPLLGFSVGPQHPLSGTSSQNHRDWPLLEIYLKNLLKDPVLDCVRRFAFHRSLVNKLAARSSLWFHISGAFRPRKRTKVLVTQSLYSIMRLTNFVILILVVLGSLLSVSASLIPTEFNSSTLLLVKSILFRARLEGEVKQHILPYVPTNSSHSLEEGMAAEALTEFSLPSLSVFGNNAVPPPTHLDASADASDVLAIAMRLAFFPYAIKHLCHCSFKGCSEH